MSVKRWLQLMLLVLFGGYQVLCFTETWRDTRGLPKLLNTNVSWPAGWRMFTLLDKGAFRLDFEGWDGEAWVRLPMERWLPTRWESGYRWERSDRDATTMRAFLAYACTRSGLEKVRVRRVDWERTPGLVLVPHKRERVKDVANRRCADPEPKIAGRRL